MYITGFYLTLLSSGIFSSNSANPIDHNEEILNIEQAKQDESLANEWELIYSQLNSTVESEPEVTLASLNILADMERKFTKKLKERVDKENFVNKLISQSELSKSKCTLVYFLERNQCLRENLRVSLSLIRYLNYYKRLQFELCKRELEVWLGHDVGRLKEVDKQIVQKLMKNIQSSSMGTAANSTHFSIEKIRKGLLLYMLELQKSVKNSTEARQIVSRSCDKVERSLNQITSIFNQFVCEEEYTSLLNNFTITWISASNTCRKVGHLLDYLLNEEEEVINKFQTPQEDSSDCWWHKQTTTQK